MNPRLSIWVLIFSRSMALLKIFIKVDFEKTYGLEIDGI
jgi:hypothetical protein